MEDNNKHAWVTLTTNDSYALGTLVLAHSLRRVGTLKKIVVMVTDGVSDGMMTQLRSVFDEVIHVSPMDSCDIVSLNLLERPELGITFTKFHCWKLTQYTKCVFLDADTLVVRNSDELFDREELSAAPDAGWPDCFNSGVFVFVPSEDTFRALMECAAREGSFDGGDQGLLNTFFSDWASKDIAKHLPFIYNMVATATYSYLPAFKKYGQNVKIVHFIGSSKPWQVGLDDNGEPKTTLTEDRHCAQHLLLWWQIYRSEVEKHLPPNSDSGCLSEVTAVEGHDLGSHDGGDCGVIQAVEEAIAERAWQEGRPDYMGSSSMENILKKIDSSLTAPKSTGIQSPCRLSSSLPSDLNNLVELETQFNHCFQPSTIPPEVDKWRWEQGNPDYMGQNSFHNILQTLNTTMGFHEDNYKYPSSIPSNDVDNNDRNCSQQHSLWSNDDCDEQHIGQSGDHCQTLELDNENFKNSCHCDNTDPSFTNILSILHPANHEEEENSFEHLGDVTPEEGFFERNHLSSGSGTSPEPLSPPLTRYTATGAIEPSPSPPPPHPSSFDFVLHKLRAAVGTDKTPKDETGSTYRPHRMICPTCGFTLPDSVDESNLRIILQKSQEKPKKIYRDVSCQVDSRHLMHPRKFSKPFDFIRPSMHDKSVQVSVGSDRKRSFRYNYY